MPLTQGDINKLEIELNALREAINQNEAEHKRLLQQAQQIIKQLKGI